MASITNRERTAAVNLSSPTLYVVATGGSGRLLAETRRGAGVREHLGLYWVNHNIVINWVRLSAQELPQLPTEETQTFKIGEVDELQTFAGSMKK
ncbi:hypothetical protein KR51_00037190 [Rubidibacter lacunae KORDI 51-2]|uniref:Uncharacterized protein n=1 Tax=Rubidibacter lacunae KORDI 51-2 TaxID=582515 RepID=U5D574_9CHRO|nr:hypothetical protein KR51_00037190 [Rubidibacter lacunae KORDI 51-2]